MSNKSRLQQIEEMLVETPDDSELRYMLAMEHVSANNDSQAVACFQEIINRDPNYPPAYHMCGRALARLNQIPDAKATLQKGIAVANQCGNLHAAGEMTELLESLEE